MLSLFLKKHTRNHTVKHCLEEVVLIGSEMTDQSHVGDYLTLGDGDFTYSYDLCRFLQAEAAIHNNSSNEISVANNDLVRVHVVCSGIDPLEEIQEKYKDSEFVKKKIEGMNGPIPPIDSSLEVKVKGAKENVFESEMKPIKRPRVSESDASYAAAEAGQRMKVSMHHSVNAIVPWSKDPSTNKVEHNLAPAPQLPQCKFKRVIFNHPHIGNEDAQLHSRFLAHFFHSVDNHWLTSKGVLHLALVKGQCERWNCIETAKKHGFILISRDKFRSPPSPGQYIKSYLEKQNIDVNAMEKKRMIPKIYLSKQAFKCRFKHRRHQSGRSFASRAKDGSETLSFAREVELDNLVVEKHLPWQNLVWVEEDENKLQCPHCEKSFGDERARKNHIKCVHVGNLEGNGTKTTAAIVCEICGSDRVFPNKEALVAHKRAKHTGEFTDIKPDWAANIVSSDALESLGGQNSSDMSMTSAKCIDGIIGKCNVCGLEYTSNAMKLLHYNEFIPQFSTCTNEKTEITMRDLLPYRCVKCNKGFRDKRAKMQHENFCSV